MTDDVRGLAVQYYNQTWDLIDRTGRTPDDDRQMLTLAMASRALWAGIGEPEQWITGDWQVPHAAAGHDVERDAWVLKARELLEQVHDPEDRAVIEGQLATVDSS